MSGGAKIALILGAAAVGAYVLLKSSGSSLLGAPATAPPGSALAPAPGAPTSTGVSTAVKVGSTVAAYGVTAGLGIATGGVGLLFTSTGRSAIKSVAGAAYGGVKSAASGVKSVVSSGVHDIESLF